MHNIGGYSKKYSNRSTKWFPPDELRRFEIRSREFGVSVHPQALRIGVLKQKRKLWKTTK